MIGIGVMLAAFNLRTAVTSVGPLLSQIQDSLQTSAAVAGVLTTLPVLAFAAIGGVTPTLIRRYCERRVLGVALTLMSLGLLTRAAADGAALFLTASAVALAGGAVGNVVVPSLVKRHFPQRVGAMTTAYSTSLAVGAMAAAALTVPTQTLFDGDWRPALGMWAIPAALALVPWLFPMSAGAPPDPNAGRRSATVRGLPRSSLAWAMLLAFGSQSLIAFVMFGWLPEILRSHGHTAAEAGFMLGVFTAVSIPVSLAVPALAAKLRDQRTLLVTMMCGYVLGLPLLWVGASPLLTWWGVLSIAIGMGTFPLLLTLLALRTRTAGGTASLSAFAQSGGYLIAGTGPLLVGVMFEATGSWTGAFVLLFVAVAAHLAAGWHTAKPRLLEDELGR